MVKPDGVAAGLTGEIISRIERRGLRLLALRKATMERAVAEEHYGEHRERPFFGELVDFITSGPVVMMAVEGDGGIAVLRTMMGADRTRRTPPPGTIRGDFALDVGQNIIHGSDGPESAARELALHFPDLGGDPPGVALAPAAGAARRAGRRVPGRGVGGRGGGRPPRQRAGEGARRGRPRRDPPGRGGARGRHRGDAGRPRARQARRRRGRAGHARAPSRAGSTPSAPRFA